ncbi:MAG: HNH endonuclease [Fermentimonas sp.]|nr:HNH endonuclease [Fermentimonas sp.]
MERYSIPDLQSYFAKNLDYSIGLLKHRKFWIEQAIYEYGIAQPKFIDWFLQNSSDCLLNEVVLGDAIADYYSFLVEKDYYWKAVQAIANEMFYTLFQNRDFLLRFNMAVAVYVQSHNIVPSRVYIPKGVQRAIFFRDRGFCALCNKDLSNTVDIVEDNQLHFDHLVSLDEGGLNDVSNIQLLCQDCNLRKHDSSYTSTKYRYWYDIENDLY